MLTSFPRTTKELFKYLVFSGSAVLGQWIGEKSVPILTYHSLDESGSTISVIPSAFREQMHYLKSHGFETITLLDFVERLKTGKLFPEKSFILTFDDGFRNLYEIAFPILGEFDFTATIFIATKYTGQAPLWELGERDRKAGIHHLPLLSWEEIEEMHRHGFTFGSHGARHIHLTQVDRGIVCEDIERSKWTIEDKLGSACRLFCYPYGECSVSVREIVKDRGFQGAVTTEFGRNKRSADPYALRRIGSAHFTNPGVFKACIYGTYGWHLRPKGKS